MKNIYKIVSVVLGILLFQNAFAASISVGSIDVVNTKTISFSLSDKDGIAEGKLEGEIKVLQDKTLDDAEASLDDLRVVTISMEENLHTNTKYSLLTLLGAEGSIDFETGDSLEDFSAINEDIFSDEENIESIALVGENILEVHYNREVVGGTYEYKLLSELEVKSIKNISSEDTRLQLELTQKIETQEDYILMIISLVGEDGEEIEFENGIYDFTSPEIIEDTEEGSVDEDLLLTTSGEELGEESLDSGEENTELNAAGDDTGLMKDTGTVALGASSTPDTGAETWVLILATLLINTFYYFSRRKVA